jgi:hypothetical protein
MEELGGESGRFIKWRCHGKNEGHGRKIELAAKKNNCLIKNDVENLVKLSRKK